MRYWLVLGEEKNSIVISLKNVYKQLAFKMNSFKLLWALTISQWEIENCSIGQTTYSSNKNRIKQCSFESDVRNIQMWWIIDRSDGESFCVIQSRSTSIWQIAHSYSSFDRALIERLDALFINHCSVQLWQHTQHWYWLKIGRPKWSDGFQWKI